MKDGHPDSTHEVGIPSCSNILFYLQPTDPPFQTTSPSGRGQFSCALHMLGAYIFQSTALSLLANMFWTLHDLDLSLPDHWSVFADTHLVSGWTRLKVQRSHGWDRQDCHYLTIVPKGTHWYDAERWSSANETPFEFQRQKQSARQDVSSSNIDLIIRLYTARVQAKDEDRHIVQPLSISPQQHEKMQLPVVSTIDARC